MEMVPLGGNPFDISDEGDDESLQHENRIPSRQLHLLPDNIARQAGSAPVSLRGTEMYKVINRIDTAHDYKLLDPPVSHPPLV